MRYLGLVFIILVLTCSCSLSSAISKASEMGMLIEPVLIADLPEELEGFKKKELLLINHNDTIIEKAYEFIVPKNYHSYSSVLSSAPTIHTFEYPSNQTILVLFNSKNTESRIVTDLDKESFEIELKNIEVARFVQWHLGTVKTDIMEERIHGIIEKNSILYCAINFISNSEESIALKKIE